MKRVEKKRINHLFQAILPLLCSSVQGCCISLFSRAMWEVGARGPHYPEGLCRDATAAQAMLEGAPVTHGEEREAENRMGAGTVKEKGFAPM